MDHILESIFAYGGNIGYIGYVACLGALVFYSLNGKTSEIVFITRFL